MNGIDFLADTNILLYILEGNNNMRPFLNNTFAVSVVSEIELLGWYKINKQQTSSIKKLLGDCFIIELLPIIKDLAIELKQKNKIKLPDAVIAATSIHLQVPLLTADKELIRAKGLNTLLLEV